MPPKKSSSRSSSPLKSTKRSSPSSPKFIPNLTQISEAAKELPDPEIWPDSSNQYLYEVDGTQHTIKFKLKSIKRGKEQTPRWIYEGKVLIRKRDA